jgi:hypothetical protein
MTTHIGRRESSTKQLDSTLAAPEQPPDRSSSVSEMRDQTPTAQELVEAWDLDILYQDFIRPGLKPLSADELEFLITRFPDVMPQVYVRPDVILLGTAARVGVVQI